MQSQFDPDSFSGIARLFPLPNMVMFPSVIQPLHVFEPRYRDMMADALDDDWLLAPVLLQTPNPDDYFEAPAIHPVACLGHVFQQEELPDGRYNLLLQGISRIRIVDELMTDKTYRTAEVQLLEDELISSPSLEADLRAELATRLQSWLPTHVVTESQMQQLLTSDLTLANLCDVLAFALPFDLVIKQQLLEELNVEARVHLLLSQMNNNASTPDLTKPKSGDRKFPPDFSAN